MRLTAILLLLGILHAGAKGFTQTVNLSVSNMPLDKVCKEIEKQTGYYFVYAHNLNEKVHLISLDLKKASIDETLKTLFKDLPFTYQLIDKVVVVNTVNPPTHPEKSPMDEGPPPIEIKGRITNAQGEPLANASVVCKKTKRGTETNANGEFVLKGLQPEDILTISFTGYRPQSVKVGNRTNFTLVLDITDNELDKTVVQAYGTTSRRFATGNIATVTAEEIGKQPVVNPLMALQGRVAGLEVTPTSGYASAPVHVDLRGINSLNPNFVSDPLYIIDGVPLTVLDVNKGVGLTFGSASLGFAQNLIGPAGGQSPFFSLNPGDIESISVLKDADATAIYGSRAANGAILITTKKGKAGRSQFTVNVSQGVSAVTRHWDMLNTQQYLQMRREAFHNDGIIPNEGNAPDLLVWDTTRYTDWQKFLWGNMGKWTDIQTGLSGGNAQTTFRIGASYNRSTDITTVSGINQRGSVSFNLNHRTYDQHLALSFTTNYSFAEANMIDISGSSTLAPNAPAPFDKLGKPNYAEWDALHGAYPFANLLEPYDSKTNFLTSNLNLNYTILKGLVARISIGYNNAQTNQTNFFPIAAFDPALGNANKGSAQFGNNRNNNWILEPQIEYNGLVGKGKINALLGGSLQSTITEGLRVIGTGYTNDALLHTISNAPTVTSTDDYGQYRYEAIFGRINYNYEGKYVLSLNARRDGSSRFGPGKQFGNFGSIGAAWIFTEEHWIKGHLPTAFSFGKLRASYGTTGSDAIGDYQYITQWNSQGQATYEGVSPLIPLINANPNYRWSVNKKLEGGLELGFLRDRINLSFTYYRNRCGNQLTSFPTPIFTGFASVTANLPAVIQNSGWEFNINARIIDRKNFTWSINFNSAINQNKLLAYPDLESSPYANQYKIGQPLNQTYVLHYTGVDPQTGQYSYQDRNHDGQITNNFSVPPGTGNDDRVRVNLSPKFMGGLGNSFSYKSWNLISFFYIKKQIGQNAIYTGGIPGTMNNNEPTAVLGRWQKPGDIRNIARFTTNPSSSFSNFSGLSDGSFTDASFIRLSNLSLSYGLPEKSLKKADIGSLRIFLNIQNLFVITKYKGLDPEIQNFGGIPPIRTFSGGLSFAF